MRREPRPKTPPPHCRPGAVVTAGLAVLLAVAGTGRLAAKTAEGQAASLEVRGEQLRAFVVEGTPDPLRPGVVVLHEWWGLNEQIRGVAERLADSGFVVIVPDFYRGKLPSDLGWAHDFMREVDEDWAIEVIDAAISYLRAMPGAAGRPVGLVGFDMGARLALAAALRGVPAQAAVTYYDPVLTDEKTVATLPIPLLGIYGRNDRATPEERIDTFKAILEKLEKRSQIIVFPEAVRFFANEERPGYDDEATRGAWSATVEFLTRHIEGVTYKKPATKLAPAADAELETDLKRRRGRRK